MALNVAARKEKRKRPARGGTGQPVVPKKPRVRRPPAPNLFAKILDVTHTEALELLRRMHRIRLFEEKLRELAAESAILYPGIAPSDSRGMEALAVGACSALRESDYITGPGAGHIPFIARGGDLKSAMAEVCGKPLAAQNAAAPGGNVGCPSASGGNIPVAAGAALACKFNRQGQVVLCFFDGGAAGGGAFHETLTLAAGWNLPVVFMCENVRQGSGAGAKAGGSQARAQSYGIEGTLCDGLVVLEVRESVLAACARAREGNGPTLIEAHTRRYPGPPRGQAQTERNREAVEAWKVKDPLAQFRQRLAEADALSPAGAGELERAVSAEVEAATKSAQAGGAPAVPRSVYKGWVDGPYGLMRW